MHAVGRCFVYPFGDCTTVPVEVLNIRRVCGILQAKLKQYNTKKIIKLTLILYNNNNKILIIIIINILYDL